MDAIRFHSKTAGWEWLSNFHPCPIVYRDILFPSVENAYHAAKLEGTGVDGDSVLQRLSLMSPAAALHYSRDYLPRIKGESTRLRVMRSLLDQKFQHEELREKLLDTGDRRLSHLAPWDEFWGTGREGLGHDYLGRLCMAVRAALRG